MDETFLPRLWTLHRYRRSGVLEVEAEGVKTFVYLREGTPVFADQGVASVTLGRVLRAQGAVTDAQYQTILSEMARRGDSAAPPRFGEVALALGILDEAALTAGLAEQVRLKVMHCAQWAKVGCRFHALPHVLSEVPELPCALEPLTLEAVRRFYDPERAERLVEPLASRRLVPGSPLDELEPRFSLKPRERTFLALLDGRRLREAMADTTLERIHAFQVVTALGIAGVLLELEEPAPEPTPPAPRAAAAPRPPAVRAPAARPPSAARPPAPFGPSAPVAEVAVTPTTPNPSLPPPPPVRVSRVRAEERFARGKDALRKGHAKRAAEDLEAAAQQHPEAIEFALWAAWARYLAQAEEPGAAERRGRLRELALQAVRQDKMLAIAHHVHGQLFLIEGDEDSARKAFRLACKLDPADKEAERRLLLLERRR
ncbi:MAG: hypothetical protein IT376_10405 [Polyangiaceae bacterium]|nr:hypothetical protein [Polyangiaceae bacterium]